MPPGVGGYDIVVSYKLHFAINSDWERARFQSHNGHGI